MKNLIKNLSYCLVAILTIVSFSSCEKEIIDPDNGNNPVDVIATDDNATTVADSAITINLTSNDNGVSIKIKSITSQPSSGTVTIDDDNNVTYTPNLGFTGTDVFYYEISDLTDNTSLASVTITVNTGGTTTPTNNAPTVNATISLESGETITVSDFTSDSDGDNVSIISITGASNGTLNVTTNSVSYTPNSGFFGNETITAVVSDGTDTVSANVTLTYGTTAQITTYDLISPYFGNTFFVGSNIPLLTVNSNGTLTSNPTLLFYNSVSATGADYVILDNGKVRISNMAGSASSSIDYTVSAFNNSGLVGLTFTGNSQVMNVWNQ